MGPGDDVASTVGVMGALRTGNPIIDVLLAFMIPVVFKMIMDRAASTSLTSAMDSLQSILLFWSPYYTREIEHKMVLTSWGGSFVADRDLRNNVLIKAIQLYLDDRQVEYRNASIVLVSAKQASDRWWDDDDEGENTPAGKLKRFRVARKPPRHRWQAVTRPADSRVELQVHEEETDKGENAEKTSIVHVYKLRSRHKGAIDTFIEDAYK